MGKLTFLDYLVVVIYITASLSIGLRYSFKQKSLESYFIAGRSAKWWAVAISAIATGLSAISFLGVPAWIFEHDLQLNIAVVLLPFVMLLVIALFAPLFTKKALTIYQYLEVRFNLAVRTFASAQFLVLRGGWLATAIYTQSLLLVEITGIALPGCVAIVGMLTAICAILGGMEAVLWTDVMQFFVLIGGLLAMLITVIISFKGNVLQIWHIAALSGHTRLIDAHFGLTQMTVWAIVINYIVESVATYGSDQIMVQRFLAARSASDVRRSILLTGLLTVPVVFLLMLVGIALVAYYATHPQLMQSLPRADRVVPHFVGSVLPPGVAGLVIAGIFAATMSALSGGFNSLATATFVDFFQRFRSKAPANPRSDVSLARWITFGWAFASSVVAMFVSRLGGIVEIFGKISGFFIGPILGVFLLGVLTRGPDGRAALIAIFSGAVFTFWVTTTSVSWLWYSPFGCAVTVLVGCMAGFMLRVPPKALQVVDGGSDATAQPISASVV